MDDRHLFRGKRLDNREWLEGSLCDGGDWKHIVFDNDFYIGKENGALVLKADRFFEVDPNTIGQCTGLRAVKSYRGDKPEDLLIFEGDICEDSLKWVFVVEWDKENARFIGRHNKPRGDTYICYIGREPPVEIIGNIHDNPELLMPSGADDWEV